MTNERKPLAETILSRIEQEHVIPKPGWEFTLRNVLWWGLWVVVIFIGACMASAILFVIANADWAFRSITHKTTFDFLMDVLPLLWLTSLAIAVLIGYKNVRQTKLGYRYPITSVVLVTLAGTLIGGLALYAVGFGGFVEQEIGQQIPRYHPAMMRAKARWMQPEHGLLIGTITERSSEASSVTLRSFDGRLWTIAVDELPAPSRAIIQQIDEIRVIGIPISPDVATGTAVFHPCFVFPWGRRGTMESLQQPLPRGFPPNERNLLNGSTTSCQGIPAFRLLHGMQDRQTP